MAAFDQIIQSAAEDLYGDERLRSNLTDSEAKLVLDWAVERVESSVKAARSQASAKLAAKDELARVRAVVTGINAFAKKEGKLRLSEAIAAVERQIMKGKPISREETMALLTALTDKVWQSRATRTKR